MAGSTSARNYFGIFHSSENRMTPNAFHWQGPSQTLDKYGRIKTERQMLLDALRVNRHEPLCTKNDTVKTQRIQRSAI
jgi:hypothetical protein